MSTSYNGRNFAPEWVSRDIGIDFEFIENVFQMMGLAIDLPDDKFGGNKDTVRDICARHFDVATQLIEPEDRPPF
jgi:hypothetical protein